MARSSRTSAPAAPAVDLAAVVAALQAAGVDLAALASAPADSPAPAKRTGRKTAPADTGEAWVVRAAWKGSEIRGGMLYTARKLGLTIPANADRYTCSKMIGAHLVKTGTPYGASGTVFTRVTENA